MKKNLKFIVVTISLLMLTVGSTWAQQRDTRTPEQKTHDFRTGLLQSISWKATQVANAKESGDRSAFQKHASDLAYLASMITEGFELKNSMPEGSAAKKEIWEDWELFLEKAHILQNATKEIASADYDMGSYDARDFGSTICGGCHREFRER